MALHGIAIAGMSVDRTRVLYALSGRSERGEWQCFNVVNNSTGQLIDQAYVPFSRKTGMGTVETVAKKAVNDYGRWNYTNTIGMPSHIVNRWDQRCPICISPIQIVNDYDAKKMFVRHDLPSAAVSCWLETGSQPDASPLPIEPLPLPANDAPAPAPVQPADNDTCNDARMDIIWNQALPELTQAIKSEIEARRTDTSAISERVDGISDDLGDLRNQIVNPEISRERIDLLTREAIEKNLPREHHVYIHTPNAVNVIKGRQHAKFDLICKLLAARQHIFVVGPAGSGKSQTIENAGLALGMPFYMWSMSESDTRYEYTGFMSANGEYVPGCIVEPFRTGGLLLLDEMDKASPNSLASLNSALSNGFIRLPNGERMDKHPDCVVASTGNTYGFGADRMYVGSTQLDAATLDRFATVTYDYDWDAIKVWATGSETPTCYDSWVDYCRFVFTNIAKHSKRYVVGARAAINGVKLLRAGIDLESVIDMTVRKGMPQSDWSIVDVTHPVINAEVN